MKNYVLITGAAGGLGKALRGWNLFLTDASQETLYRAAPRLERIYGVKAPCLVCDLTSSDERQKLPDALAHAAIRFDCLVNNAGLDFEGPFTSRAVEVCLL